MTPLLMSARLKLRSYSPLLVTDEHVSWLNDADLMQYSEQRFINHTFDSQVEYVVPLPPRHLWLLSFDGKDIGSISAYVDEKNNRANLGILLGCREFHGQGFAAEAWTTVITWLFDQGIHKVECGCREDNAPMRRLALTTGMIEEANIPGHFKVGDEYRDLILYGRFAAEKYHSQWNTMWREPFWKAEK